MQSKENVLIAFIVGEMLEGLLRLKKGNCSRTEKEPEGVKPGVPQKAVWQDRQRSLAWNFSLLTPLFLPLPAASPRVSADPGPQSSIELHQVRGTHSSPQPCI